MGRFPGLTYKNKTRMTRMARIPLRAPIRVVRVIRVLKQPQAPTGLAAGLLHRPVPASRPPQARRAVRDRHQPNRR